MKLELTPEQQVSQTFISYFRKRKGIYSQEDVEKIVEKALTDQRRQISKEILYPMIYVETKTPNLSVEP